jgi:hypothetical protein
LESLRIKNRPKKTISGKTYELGLFTASCKKSCMDELASADMLGFRDYLRSETYAERTVYNYLMTTTTFLNKNGLYKIVGLLEAEDWPEVPPTEPEPYTEGLCTNPNSFCYPVDVGPLHVRHFLFATTCAYEESDDEPFVPRRDGQQCWKPKTTAGTRKIPLSENEG